MILAYCTECWAKKVWRTAENTGVFKLGNIERCEKRKRKNMHGSSIWHTALVKLR